MHIRVGSSVYRQASKPKMYIMRGVSGSGKSTKAKTLAPPDHIFSTDDFFTTSSGDYNFDIRKIGEAHQWNQRRVWDAAKQRMDPIVVDNTTVKGWEAKPYVVIALTEGYDVEFVESDSPWWRTHRQDMSDDERWLLAQTLAEKNTHNVPADIIEKMLNRWEFDLTPEKALRSQRPF